MRHGRTGHLLSAFLRLRVAGDAVTTVTLLICCLAVKGAGSSLLVCSL
ncbi:hypothetical protein RchiOBHm_Chr2g0097201 [Rosa chinensis]|uniref:Uncharacterized protein n=1 Tax=Rosa chinensis TaxID=74649 RepID=A0A2P6RLA8_ROSCH|nr:hypothetical protein RchiOBHm_Chr2g0097201 [Rosa chinensis]